MLYFVLFYSHLITHTLSRTHHSTTLLSLTLTLCSVIAVPRFSLHLETPSLPQSQPITILMAALALALLLLAFTGTSSMLFFQTPFLQSITFFFFFFIVKTLFHFPYFNYWIYLSLSLSFLFSHNIFKESTSLLARDIFSHVTIIKAPHFLTWSINI